MSETGKRTTLGGVVPATITPFDAEERINADALRTLMTWNQSQGADSFDRGRDQEIGWVQEKDKVSAVQQLEALPLNS